MEFIEFKDLLFKKALNNGFENVKYILQIEKV